MNNVLPNSPEHEQSIISGLLRNPVTTKQVFDVLGPDDFYRTGHRLIFEILVELHRSDEPVDITNAVMALRERGLLEKAGGAAFIAGLPDTCPVPSNVDHYCQKLRELSVKRKLAIVGNEIMKRAAESVDGIDDLLGFAQKAISDAGAGHESHTRKPFELVHAGGIEVNVPEFLITDFIETDTLSLSFADAGSCKSFFVDDMGLSIACGVDFHGIPVRQGPVIFIIGEGQKGIIRRFMAWSIVRGIDYKKHPVYISMMPAALCDESQVDHVLKAIRQVSDEVGPPLFIVLDTVARNFGPGDENSTADMTRFIAAADKIRSLYHSAVHLVHHTGHADKNRGRGSAALRAALDAEYKLERDRDGIIRVEATKMKDAALPEPMAFKLRQVELPIQNEDGSPVTSAVLHRIDYQPLAPSGGNAGKGANQQMAMSVLSRLYEEHREKVKNSGRCPDSARVLYDDWRSACMDEEISRTAFWKTKESLLKLGAIQVEGPYVLIP